jgi:hypothetical protein
MINVENLSGFPWGTSRIMLSANMEKVLKAPSIVGPSGVLRRKLDWADNGADCAACDPEIFKWTDGYFYLVYAGAVDKYHTVEYISRSTSLSGPFEKLDATGNWLRNAPNPKIIVYPKYVGQGEAMSQVGDKDSYGAGQATTVIKNNQIYLWLHDYSFKTNNSLEPFVRLTLRTTTNPASWPSTSTLTNIQSIGSGVVRLDASSGKFRYFYLDPFILDNPAVPQTKYSILFYRESTDGITWSSPRALFRFPVRSREIGVAENPDGSLPNGKVYVSWSAPTNALSRSLPDYGIWTPSSLYFAEAPTASVDSTTAVNRPSSIPLLGALATTLPEISSPNQYAYAPAIVKNGNGWNVYFCSTPYIDRTRRAAIRHEVQ